MANQFRVRKGLIVNGSGSTLLDVQGSQGQLFSITDSLSGSLFAAKDISGIPVIEAFSDNRVNIGTFNQEAIKVSGSFAFVTGSLNGTASWALNSVTASFVTTAQTASFVATASWANNAVTASFVTLAQTASFVTTAQTASFVATSSWARNSITASYVLNAVSSSFSTLAATASFVTASNVFGPFGSNSVISSSFAVTASYVLGGASTINIQDEGSPQGSAGTINFVGAGVTAAVAGGTATVTITGGGGGSITIADEGVAQGTATFLNFIGNGVSATVTSNTASIVINATGSTALHTQVSPATTWSFNHNLNNNYPVLNVWDSNGFMIMPGGVKTINTNNIEIYFDIAQAGYASAVVGGTATSASYALTASYALNGGSGPATATDFIASGIVTASVAASSDGIFLIKSGSVSMFEISGSGRFTANSSIFIIKNYTTQQPVFTVSESIVKFATQSAAPTGNPDPGAIWVTATDLYIGLN